jgi:hypothetical protein
MTRSAVRSMLGLFVNTRQRSRSCSSSRSRPKSLGIDRLETRAMFASDSGVSLVEQPITQSLGEQAGSNLVNIGPIAPSVPNDVVATAGDGFVNLMWREPGNSGTQAIRNYRIFMTEDGITWTRVVRPRSTALTATISGLTNGKSYGFRLQASNNLFSEFTPPVYRVPQGFLRSDAPFNVVAQQASSDKINLSWSPPSNPGGHIQDYVVRYSSDGVTWRKFARPASSDLATTITGLDYTNRHAFRVRAITTNGVTPPSVPSAFVRHLTVPYPPTYFVATVVAPGVVTLTWSVPYDGGRPILDYGIYWKHWKPVAGTDLLVSDSVDDFDNPLDERLAVRVEAEKQGTRASVTLRNLEPSRIYTFAIRARNVLGQGAYTASGLTRPTSADTSILSPQ